MPTLSEAANSAEQVARPSEQALLDAWRQLVEDNAAQVERLTEREPHGGDFWAEGFASATISSNAVNPADEYLASIAGPDETWLDIGAGYGRTTLPLARNVRRITAVDPSPGLTERIRASIAEHGIANIDVLEADAWPPRVSPGVHDACIAVNVVNFVANIGPFLDAMDAHARTRCVIVATELGTAWQPVEPVFEELHGERFIRQPALQEILALLSARRRRFDVATFSFDPPWGLNGEPLDVAHARVRSHYLVREGSEKDARLGNLLAAHFGIGNGLVQMPPPMGRFTAAITWDGAAT
ncbi:MAG TPA: methyltransferase domain-containing protein [Thermomicrobiales bacterium]|nr:methyltransferase domain-containing protein [Thermomicrobiales bacterium]